MKITRDDVSWLEEEAMALTVEDSVILEFKLVLIFERGCCIEPRPENYFEVNSVKNHVKDFTCKT